MQTFLPFASFTESAKCLDRQRLGQQRREAKAILSTVIGQGNMNHPTVSMWRPFGVALCQYGQYICQEWISRGYKDETLDFFNQVMETNYADAEFVMPEWNFMEELHKNHRQRLIEKNKMWYEIGQGWKDGPVTYNLWPQFDGDKWILRRTDPK